MTIVIKKIFFMIVVALLVVVFGAQAQAAVLVPGSVPSQQPLQPLPTDATPNVSRNIQDSSEEAPAASQEDVPAAVPDMSDVSGTDLAPGQIDVDSPVPAESGSDWVMVVIVIVLVLVLGALAYLRWFVKRKPPQ